MIKSAVVAAVVTVTALVAVPAAHAALVTHCVGTGGAVTVPNDLLVPAGESCTLTGTIITGNVSVLAGANLVTDGVRIAGDLQIAGDGYLDADGSTVNGSVELAAGGYGVYLRDSTTGSVAVRPQGSAPGESFLFVEASSVSGTVNAQAGQVRLDRGSAVSESVSTNNSHYTDVHDSFVDGTLSVLNSAGGSVVCGSAVRGKSTFAGNLGGVQLGPNGRLDSCASGGYFGREVGISNTTGGVTVDDTIIDGALNLAGNSPVAQVAANNRIRGGVHGPQALGAVQRRAPAAEARDTAVDRSAGDRRTSAVREATAAGPADL
ncbi:hypothetical protein [Actinoplanes derwentensis]|uniref:Right handed beta helix region n=1 Tax=Actinoplanes derwentensis TaxID=113562 RepID=A0A1H1X5P9_9ACTN|nr:hypothetical protein [Actinoplanes derwentensis]GID85706.1 hypothetical protein Ade03nite_46300 [Actinoplanes derwentensis]SDT04675.1 hypothetical protein SAMN04489716_2352 [Actinoplanes derwentensis]